MAYSYRRSWDPSKTRVLVDSSRGDGQHRQIYELNIPAIYDATRWPEGYAARRLTYSDGSEIPPNGPYPGYVPSPANEFNPSISPDGTKIAYVSDRDGVPQIYLMTADGNNPLRLTTSGCIDQVPAWSPDGRTLYWESQCSGQKFKIMAAELAYSDDSIYGAYATLANVRELTAQSQGDNRFPRVAPDGSRLVITSYRDGNAELYTDQPGWLEPDPPDQQPRRRRGRQLEPERPAADVRQQPRRQLRDLPDEPRRLGPDPPDQPGQPDRWVLWAQ